VTVLLRIGGFTFAIRSPRPLPALDVPRRLTGFRARSRADVSLEVEATPPPTPLPRDLLFDSGGLWKAYRDGRRVLYQFRAPVGFAGHAIACSIDPARRRGLLYLDPRFAKMRGFVFDYPIDELLLQHHAARAGAFVVHACGVRWKGRVLLLCGQSGAGKTTLARVWRRHRRDAAVLSDDRLVVRASDPTITAWGTPWHGSGRFASPEGARLDAVFFLEQADESGTSPMAVAEAAASVFARSFPPPWEAAGMSRVLRSCARVAQSIPCFRLRFRPDASAVKAVERAIE